MTTEHVLLLDASLPVAVVAIGNHQGIVGQLLLREQRQHSERLAQAVEQVLAEAHVAVGQLTAIAVGRGPGSYMGIRTAMALAQGLAFARRVPLRGLGTLEVLRAGAEVELAFAPAKRGFWYGQRAGEPSLWLDEAALCAVVSSSASWVMPASAMAAAWDALAPLAWDDAQRASVVTVESPDPVAMWQAWYQQRGREDELDTLRPDYVRAPDAALPSRDPAWQLDAVRAMTTKDDRE
jgi:tRNA threonylcarbamoyl adenosine modification protein YeaZ